MTGTHGHEAIHETLDKAFSKRIRLGAENAAGQFSSVWMFWGNKSDFYFGAKALLGSFKVSLHENGIGYVAYHKPYFLKKQSQGIPIPSKTATEWKLPVPGPTGAVQAASVFLPADYCRSAPPSEAARKKTLVLGVEKGCAAEIGIFLSRENHPSLEAKFLPWGHPLFMVTLDNGHKVSIVVRSTPFNPSVLPTNEQTQAASKLLLQSPQDIPDSSNNLNAMLWTLPPEGGCLQVIDVGGVGYAKNAATGKA